MLQICFSLGLALCYQLGIIFFQMEDIVALNPPKYLNRQDFLTEIRAMVHVLVWDMKFMILLYFISVVSGFLVHIYTSFKY